MYSLPARFLHAKIDQRAKYLKRNEICVKINQLCGSSFESPTESVHMMSGKSDYSSTGKWPNCAVSTHDERSIGDGRGHKPEINPLICFLFASQLVLFGKIGRFAIVTPIVSSSQKKTEKSDARFSLTNLSPISSLKSHTSLNISNHVSTFILIVLHDECTSFRSLRQLCLRCISLLCVVCVIYFVCPHVKQLIIAVMSSIFSVVLLALNCL